MIDRQQRAVADRAAVDIAHCVRSERGDQEHGHALSEGQARGDGGWADLYGHARPQGAGA